MDPDRSDCRDDRDISIIYAIKDQLIKFDDFVIKVWSHQRNVKSRNYRPSLVYIWWIVQIIQIYAYTQMIKIKIKRKWKA
jgi:hypothetical protein